MIQINLEQDTIAEYMNNFKKFSEEKFLDKKCFYNSLKDQHIDDKDYLTCNKILNKFSMKNMSDYHGHYLKKDVSLLVDVFETFTDTSLKY